MSGCNLAAEVAMRFCLRTYVETHTIGLLDVYTASLQSAIHFMRLVYACTQNARRQQLSWLASDQLTTAAEICACSELTDDAWTDQPQGQRPRGRSFATGLLARRRQAVYYRQRWLDQSMEGRA